jgi:hypothetical protein
MAIAAALGYVAYAESLAIRPAQRDRFLTRTAQFYSADIQHAAGGDRQGRDT